MGLGGRSGCPSSSTQAWAVNARGGSGRTAITSDTSMDRSASSATKTSDWVRHRDPCGMTAKQQLTPCAMRCASFPRALRHRRQRDVRNAAATVGKSWRRSSHRVRAYAARISAASNMRSRDRTHITPTESRLTGRVSAAAESAARASHADCSASAERKCGRSLLQMCRRISPSTRL